MVVCVLVSATPVLTQTGRPSSPSQSQNQRQPTPTNQSAGRTDALDPVVTIPKRPQWRLLPATPTRSTATIADLKKNLDDLQMIDAKLQQAIEFSPAPDFAAIVVHAATIERLAKCLQSIAGLRGTGADESRPPQRDERIVSKDDLKQLATGISKSIEAMAHSPVVQQLNIIDANLIAEAGMEVQKLISLSEDLRKQAEAQSKRVTTSSIGTGSKTHYKRPPYVQLTLECSVWTANRFSQQPAKVKPDSRLKIDGVSVQVEHHKLTVPQLIDLEECMPCSFDERAQAAGERYAVLLKDFHSYLSKRRTFAYHALYQIVRVKDGKITHRLDQPVSLYFIDYGGQGEFELAQKVSPLPLPEWIRDLDSRR